MSKAYNNLICRKRSKLMPMALMLINDHLSSPALARLVKFRRCCSRVPQDYNQRINSCAIRLCCQISYSHWNSHTPDCISILCYVNGVMNAAPCGTNGIGVDVLWSRCWQNLQQQVLLQISPGCPSDQRELLKKLRVHRERVLAKPEDVKSLIHTGFERSSLRLLRKSF